MRDRAGRPGPGREAEDLALESAELVILSGADSELSGLARAVERRRDGAPTIALANMHALGSPVRLDRLVARARYVLVRLLGGESYWPEGVRELTRLADERGFVLACLPGDARWDPELVRRSTLSEDETRSLWRYFVEGGPDNMDAALDFMAHAIGAGPEPEPARPAPSAGLWPAPVPSDGRPRAAILFYRALLQGGMTAPVAALAEALERRGMAAQPVFVTSLKDEASAATVRSAFASAPPDVIINATAFAVGSLAEGGGGLAGADCPVLQVAFASASEADWRGSSRGLDPRDLAMHVVLPEVDGRVFAGAVAFKERVGRGLVESRPVADRVDAAADLAIAWARLRRTAPDARRLAIILNNYPSRDGRMANGVGLDSPESYGVLADALRAAGYDLGEAPRSGAELMRLLGLGPTNELAGRAARRGGVRWPLAAYRDAYGRLPEGVRAAVEARWGAPSEDPHVQGDVVRLAVHRFGNLAIGVQPARGYHVDPAATAHSPDLAPPHGYLAFYLWIRTAFDAHAVLHLGKHGNLEWLPGKSTGLSAECFPSALLGPLPNVYPFIVNDPGEGIQAKRRAGAVVVDHLTPPLARAELHGELAALETLLDEHALAADLDPPRAASLRRDILAAAGSLRLEADLPGPDASEPAERLRLLDAHLCDLKEMQIRDGLHVLGRAPEGSELDALLVAVARLPRSELRPADASLHRALAADLGLGGFDPLGRDLGVPYPGPRSPALAAASASAWRTTGDTVERIEALALELVAGRRAPDPGWARTSAVLDWVETELRPRIARSGAAELASSLAALEGRFVSPGPAGAPTRGRPDVLPTGRNFFAVDVRAVPSETAWRTGREAAERLVAHYRQDHGAWPQAVALSCWGTANMRTGGDDLAQALALVGARPVWEGATGRVTGFAVTPLTELGRPRVDVTLRVSGLFRDAFPTQIELFDSVVATVAALDEPEDANPIAARVREEAGRLMEAGLPPEAARSRASARVFGSKPGAYGAGLQALVDEGAWGQREDLAEAYLAWSAFAYGAGRDGEEAGDELRARLAAIDAVAQAQDNREHDVLDADDYYQFMGGLAAAAEQLSGRAPPVYHLDTSRPEAPVSRTLATEIARVVRGRAANPKWIAGVMRHGYKGAFEIAATVDYLFGFAATTNAVSHHHFDQLYTAYIEDERVRAFMADANPAALRETAERFAEAIRRGLWRPRSNRAADLIGEIAGACVKEAEEVTA